MNEVVQANRHAVERSVEIVSQVTVDRLDLATPCEGWMLRDLLEHMIVQHIGFARAAEGETTDLAAWKPTPIGDDPAGSYAAAADRVNAAFGAHGVLARQMYLPEFPAPSVYPAETAIGFHLADYVVHGWDVARSLGIDAGYPDDLVAAAMPHVLAVPSDPSVRDRPGGPFKSPVEVPDDAPPLDRAVAYLGRDPDWPASAG